MTECEGCEKYTKEKLAADRAANPGFYEKMELASMLIPVPGAAFGKLGKVITLAFVGVAREVKRVDSPTNKMNIECPAPAFPFAAESRLGLRVYSSLN